MDQAHLLLKKYWNHQEFRPFQQEIISSVLSGNDTLALLPTGGGKSLCYQLPALMKEGFCLVISPLIALMQDQVTSLLKKDIPAAFIHSGMTKGQVSEVLNNALHVDYKILYVSPERLLSEAFKDYFPDFNLNLIAVDEAHCISQWGHDFRPAYRQISALTAMVRKGPTLALTATATPVVENDIIHQLAMRRPARFRKSIVRKNLFYHVRYTESKHADLTRLYDRINGSSILYCRSRRRCADLAIAMRQEGLNATAYHAGMPRSQREAAQQQWQCGDRQIMSATTAFGMGIDKADVRLVTHFDVPDNLEEYYQEAGRAGRDGAKAYAVLFYNQADISRLEDSIATHFPEPGYIKTVYQYVGDYLGLAVGKGNEMLFQFDLPGFLKNFQLETRKTISAIKILEREGYWIWNDNDQTKSNVHFTTSKAQLAYLEKHNPRLSSIVVGLLRLHGSIFHFPTPLKLFDTARLLRLTTSQLEQGLSELAALGIIDYQPAIYGSTLLWLHDRQSAKYLPLNEPAMRQLRQIYEERIQAMIHYLTTRTVCRNIQLARYFGEPATTPCGNCDVCRQQKVIKPHKKSLQQHLLALFKDKDKFHLDEISGHFPETEKQEVMEALRLLHDEGYCVISRNGEVIVK